MKFNNINKRVIAALMAGTMSLSFVGCSEIKDKYRWDDTEQVYSLTDNYSLSELKFSVYLVETKQENEWDLHLSYVQSLDYDGNYILNKRRVSTVYNVYHDVFTNEILYTENISNNNVKNDNVYVNNYIDIDSYLVKYNLIKESYTEEDLKQLLEFIKKDYIFNYDKQKVKQK